MGENRPDLTLDGHDTEPYQTLFKDKGGDTRQERRSTQTVGVIPLVRRGHRGQGDTQTIRHCMFLRSFEPRTQM